jgi:hypothetical protein
MSTDNKWYSGLNIIGAGLCGYSSYLILFYPFVILEGVWVLAALSSFIKHVLRETIAKKEINRINRNCSTWNIKEKRNA